MNITFILLFISFTLGEIHSQGSAQSLEWNNSNSQLLYSTDPNHRELVLKSLELAVSAGFNDTSNISLQEIRDRLEAGAYSEDFDAIPGIVGEHFPEPWNQGPEFNFYGFRPAKIPYAPYTDTLSGWYRGLNHGYDPVQDFKWPGAYASTVEWANLPINTFMWNNAINLYDSGEFAEAYECLGHILHLLADLSVPSHVKVVNHGMSITNINSGTILDPDLMELIIDEYEIALSGGVQVPGFINIPDLLSNFNYELDLANPANIPILPNWNNYLEELGQLTYNHPVVNQFYIAPVQEGQWGFASDEYGVITPPTTIFTLPVSELNGRWVQVTIKSTASANGTILPEAKMLEMCNDLVPKAVEYGAGLLLHFYNRAVINVSDDLLTPAGFQLYQNYPNPFNPSTKIKFTLPSSGSTSLKIFNTMGEEVTILLDKALTTGTYEVEWNAVNYPSGVYFYQLQTENFVKTKKMILMK